MAGQGDILSALIRLEARLIWLLKGLLGLGLIAMVPVNVINAAGRYGGLPTLTGADELLVFGMIWIVMLGAILATRERAHLAIDLLPERLSKRSARYLVLLTEVVTVAVAGFVAWHSAMFIGRIGALGQTSMGLGVPMVIPHSAIFIGFTGIALISGLLVLSDIATLRREGAE